MALRIYALAKELNIDSKILVELCQKAGVTGKGSALASLTDEETTTVRSFLSHGGAKAQAAPAPPRPAPAASTATAEASVFRREDYIPPTGGGKPQMLGTKPESPSGESKRRPPDTERSKAGPAIRVAPMPVVEQPTAPTHYEPPPQKPD